jgi:hypothetical protein
MSVRASELERMSPAQRDRVFRDSRAGEIPHGKGDGVALLPLGRVLTRIAAGVVGALVWKGKLFDPRYDGLRNRLTPLDLKLIRAQVYRDPSLIDGRDCIVLDYSRTSVVAHWIRDEIREVGNGTYLGQVFVRGRRLMHFTLSFPRPE